VNSGDWNNLQFTLTQSPLAVSFVANGGAPVIISGLLPTAALTAMIQRTATAVDSPADDLDIDYVSMLWPNLTR
jgi:hypothetical protein